ncbi:MAG: DMT family transporter [Chthoniobacter sp.]|uniref:EamA family transporter n=1 Tax=Chthoniobacter sp. TaxID=2510640 RepID=UPI0032A1838E
MLVPLGSALGYAFAAMMLKRGTEGAGPWRVNFSTNWVQATLFSLFWFVPTAHAASFGNVSHAVISGTIFFVGQIFTFLALSRGDVSVATPVLGSKVIFVALFSAALGTEKIGVSTWLAVLLTGGATALLSIGNPQADREAVFRSLLYGFSAAAVYALTDITQQRWVREWGFSHYIATLFLTVAVLSLTLIPLLRGDGREVTPASWRWIVAGGCLLAVQASGIAWSIITIGATSTNVLYNSRGLWSVVLVWTIGSWFGNAERGRGRAVMLRRFAGSLLLLGAILLIAHR